MSDDPTSSLSKQTSRAAWVRIHQMTDADIDYSDSPSEDEAFWAEADQSGGCPYPRRVYRFASIVMWWSGLRRKGRAAKAASTQSSGPIVRGKPKA